MSNLQVLSLGAGVQSSVLLLMSCRGELPKLDLAIFADTQWEPKAVYEHLEWLKGEADAVGIPVVTVTAGNLRDDAIEFRRLRKSCVDGKRYASMPLFVANPDGSTGIIRRQCTSDYKINPIERYLRREVLGLKPRQRAPKSPVLDQWRGITIDEPWRLKDGDKPWYRVVYPFCGLPASWAADHGAKRTNRHDCKRWFSAVYPGRNLPRSACIGCPFHSNAEWRKLRDDAPAEWQDAIAFDQAIRVADAEGQRTRRMLVGMPYLHHSCLPLGQAPIDGDSAPSLWGSECEGMCGL